MKITDEKKTVEPYMHSMQYAVYHNELELYRASFWEHLKCRDAIDVAISQARNNNRLNSDAVKEVFAQFGPERTLYVLANTVQHKPSDDRISQSNKQWAQDFPVAKDVSFMGDDMTLGFVAKSHPSLLDNFVRAAREEAELRQAEHHRENPLKNAEMSLEDDYGMIDGIINNGPKDPPKPTRERPSVLEKLREKKAKVRASGKTPDDRSLKSAGKDAR